MRADYVIMRHHCVALHSFVVAVAVLLAAGACGSSPQSPGPASSVDGGTPPGATPGTPTQPTGGVPDAGDSDGGSGGGAGEGPTAAPWNGGPESTTTPPSTGSAGTAGSAGGTDAPDGGTAVTSCDVTRWPNGCSSTNGDAWLREHHDDIEELHPRVVAVLADNGNTPENVTAFAEAVAGAFAEGSRYHGYHDSSAKPQLLYDIVKVVDLRDGGPNPWPASWPMAGSGDDATFVYEGIFTQEFAVHYGYSDPQDATRFLTLCELFERGVINELWVAAPRGPKNPWGVYESKSNARVYDDALQPTDQMNACAGNGCFDPGTAGLCPVTVRLMELALDRGVGCATHAAGHGMEGVRATIPYYKANSARFFGAELDSRYHLPIDSLYSCDYAAQTCWKYPDDHTLENASATGPVFSFDHWGEQCGNVHFPPNGTAQYDYYSTSVSVRSTCEDYGGRHGVNSNDAQTRYSFALVQDYDNHYGDCGGGWQIYMRQSMPGHGNGGTGDDGQPMKNWWPFLFY